jgi:putative protease
VNKTPELVMPAGTLEKLKFACAYGADAVYAGIPKFSLRARTNSFTETQLAEGITYAHARGVNVYITLNIFAHNSRIQPSLQALRRIMELKPDALIMSDPGLIMLTRQEFPDLELHLSTQANTMNWAAVRFWKDQGINRVILPRELSIQEIKQIHEHVPDIELEVFVHGAMCISYSGRCLLSSYITHRDANLGVCTNNCRWQYKIWKVNSPPGRGQGWVSDESPLEGGRGVSSPLGRSQGRVSSEYALEEITRPGEFFLIEEDEHGAYILNSRDLCAIEYLQELWEAGVTGFKIEGRTKSVYYLSQIGRAYRKAIDTIKAGESFDSEVFMDIQATATRGFIPGFLTRIPEETRQNYELGQPVYSTHKFGGIARNYDREKGTVEVEVKNKIVVGEIVEFVSPHNLFVQPIRTMYDLSYNPITVAHGGGENVLLSTGQAVEPFTILRIRL